MLHIAQHDQLTELPNRALLTDRLIQTPAHARRERKTAALMFLDLDRFKAVNDTLGHEIGDRLLREVAARLKDCVGREEDTVSRLGGDEFVLLMPQIFVLLMPQIAAADDAAVVARKAIAAIARPFETDGHRISVRPASASRCIPPTARPRRFS